MLFLTVCIASCATTETGEIKPGGSGVMVAVGVPAESEEPEPKAGIGVQGWTDYPLSDQFDSQITFGVFTTESGKDNFASGTYDKYSCFMFDFCWNFVFDLDPKDEGGLYAFVGPGLSLDFVKVSEPIVLSLAPLLLKQEHDEETYVSLLIGGGLGYTMARPDISGGPDFRMWLMLAPMDDYIQAVFFIGAGLRF